MTLLSALAMMRPTPVPQSKKLISVSRVRVLLVPLLAAIILTVQACASSPPVQEMSDARQAIAAAEQANAATRAPDTLAQARRLLETAERQLREEAYGPARVNAVRAKNRAVQALEASQSASQAEP